MNGIWITFYVFLFVLHSLRLAGRLDDVVVWIQGSMFSAAARRSADTSASDRRGRRARHGWKGSLGRTEERFRMPFVA